MPLPNSAIVNSATTLAKMNNTLQNVVTKTNALKQESSSSSGSSSGGSGNASPMEVTPRMQQQQQQQTSLAKQQQPSTTSTASKVSGAGDVDDIPLNSRIPSPLKHKSSILNQQTTQSVQQQVLGKSLGETDVLNHTNEHKIGGGRLELYSMSF